MSIARRVILVAGATALLVGVAATFGNGPGSNRPTSAAPTIPPPFMIVASRVVSAKDDPSGLGAELECGQPYADVVDSYHKVVQAWSGSAADVVEDVDGVVLRWSSPSPGGHVMIHRTTPTTIHVFIRH